MLRGGGKTLQKEEGEGSVQRGGKEKVVLKRSSGISRRRWHREGREAEGVCPRGTRQTAKLRFCKARGRLNTTRNSVLLFLQKLPQATPSF